MTEGGGRWDRHEERSIKTWPNGCVGRLPVATTSGWHGGLYRKQVVDGVYRLDEGALLDDFFYFLQQLGVVDLLNDVRSTAIQREMVPVVQDVLL
jgi:hypothetical protein